MLSVKKGIVDTGILEFLRSIWDQYKTHARPKHFYTSLDKRILIDRSWQGFEKLVPLAEAMYPEGIDRFQAYYERQYVPTPLHIDPEVFEYTVIVPIYHDPRIKTLAWKQQFKDINTWTQWVIDFDPAGQTPKNSVGESGLIDHTFDENKGIYIADYLDFDGVFDYDLGSAAGFYSNQVHCSSNWRKLGFEYKDWVAIHYHKNPIG